MEKMHFFWAVIGLFCILFYSKGCDVTLTGTGAASGGTAEFQYNTVPTTGSNTYDVAKGSDPPKVRVDYVSGSPNGAAQENTGITFTGDEATGNIAFTFANVASSDNGIYTLTNSLGTELQCMTLHILGDVPTVQETIGTSNTNGITVGESVSLTCTATSHANPVAPLAYSWTKGGVTISGETSSSLTISSAVTTDSGEYKCIATEDITGGQSTTSTGISITVIGGPSPGPGGGCNVIICFIGPIVTFVFALVKLIMYFTACYEILVFEDILSKKFGVRIVSPSAVMFVIGIVLAISLCLAVSECEWETGVSVVVVIICCPCGSVGIIIVHHKYIRVDNSTAPGHSNGEPGLRLQINSGQGQGQRPVKGDSELGRGRGDQEIHLRSEPAGGNVGRPTEGSKHQRSKESSSGQPIRPQPPLPPISGTEATRGHPIEEFPDKNRLTPLGKEAEFQFEDTPRKKKKKKKSERKDTEDEN